MADGTRAVVRSRRRRKAAPITTPDPVEIAMEAEATGRAPGGIAADLLFEQRRLIRWEIADRRAGFTLKVLTAAAAAAAALALALLAWQARGANALIVEPFSVPPEFAQEGLSGAAVSSLVLDELASLQARADRGRVDAGRFRGVQQEIKVAIPTTGVSLGDLQAALRTWLGHETHITGEVHRTSTGRVVVRARLAGREGVRIEGSADDVEDVARRTAHAIFRQTSPLDYALLIGDAGDRAGAIDVLKPLAIAGGSAEQRAEAYRQWSYHVQFIDMAAATLLAKEAIGLAPYDGRNWMQLQAYEGRLGHLEEQLRTMSRGIALSERRPNKQLRPEARDLSASRGERDMLSYDLQAAIEAYRRVDANPFFARGSVGQTDMFVVRTLGSLHDMAGARARLAAPRFQRPGVTPRPADVDSMATARLYLAILSEDWADAIAAEHTIAERMLSGSGVFRSAPTLRYMAIYAYAKHGDSAAARERLQLAAPPDCASCLYYSARAYAALGDSAFAEREFARAARLLPTLPQAHLYWGQARLERGDAAGALPLLREAQRRQPKWADPLKFEADALAALGRWREAEALYAKAEPLAPKWGRLHLKWGEALAKLGNVEEARAHWRAAAGMDLSAAERAELVAVSRNRAP